jgi:dihydroorotate dehydrogenase electron transfer subunit
MLPAMIVDLPAEVLDNRPLSAEYNVLTLAAPRIAETAHPGQFVMVKTGTGLEPLLRRPFSIFERVMSPDGTPRGISILNKRVGLGTGQVYDAAPGSTLQVLGPLGLPFPAPVPASDVWMVAGGVGLAPFWTLADSLAASDTSRHLFYGARRAGDLHYASWFETRGVQVHRSTEDGSEGDHGLVTVPLARAFEARTADRPLSIYCCGPTPMMQAVAALAARHGHETWVSLEQVMGCGMGGCYSCVVPTRQPDGSAHFVRSCVDGPVFAASTLVWDALTSGHA